MYLGTCLKVLLNGFALYGMLCHAFRWWLHVSSRYNTCDVLLLLYGMSLCCIS